MGLDLFISDDGADQAASHLPHSEKLRRRIPSLLQNESRAPPLRSQPDVIPICVPNRLRLLWRALSSSATHLCRCPATCPCSGDLSTRQSVAGTVIRRPCPGREALQGRSHCGLVFLEVITDMAQQRSAPHRALNACLFESLICEELEVSCLRVHSTHRITQFCNFVV